METEDLSKLELVNNTELPKKRFELKVGENTAIIEYILTKDDVIYLTHTEVPRQLEGQGVGSTIVKKTLAYIKEKGYKLVPLCPFVAAYLKRHPELGEGILQKGYTVS
ncbi:N-acetyltransferase [Aquimarina sp. ERC-38]|uniref:GNAT family N-acetyltransferase n=1 Tax=Aquimarina sp. ERC-38 TaxID=2949996 RepID=UPI0022468EC4|nr:GNAT family N-acetyltransferase [Aquimarina sp. ERC-38]UZO82482.1 N-acetyltransferase [Aquimarina sp. ERC-38]